jgi:O-methyltransferase
MTPEWFENVCMSSLGHRSSQEATYDTAIAALVHDIPGDFVECGVYAGAQSALMAAAIMDHYGARFILDTAPDGVVRRVHLFDTFAGIPAPGEYDTDLVGNVGGESACSIEDVKANMRRWAIPEELLVYWEGAIEDTATMWEDTEIAVLRLDLDLYDGTLAALRHLYPFVSPGGYVIVDDFNLAGCRRAVRDYFSPTAPAPVMWRKPK